MIPGMSFELVDRESSILGYDMIKVLDRIPRRTEQWTDEDDGRLITWQGYSLICLAVTEEGPEIIELAMGDLQHDLGNGAMVPLLGEIVIRRETAGGECDCSECRKERNSELN